MQNKSIYILVLVLSVLLVLIALGGGLWGQTEPWFLQWQHKLFYGLCHQSPERSFWINGQPMAVCSRCFGIYTGFFGGLITAFLVMKRLRNALLKKVLLVMLILNIVDVAGNILSIWQNTLFSRYVLGFLLAATAGLMLGKALIKQPTSINHLNNYGTNRTV